MNEGPFWPVGWVNRRRPSVGAQNSQHFARHASYIGGLCSVFTWTYICWVNISYIFNILHTVHVPVPVVDYVYCWVNRPMSVGSLKCVHMYICWV